jgi:hypothetical protein
MQALGRLLEFVGADPLKRNYAGKSPLAVSVEKGENFAAATAVLEVRTCMRACMHACVEGD